MLVLILLCLLGLAVLTVAADHLVLGASRLAARLHIDPVVVGVVVIGLGTSAPEFLVSGVAAARGDAGIAVGNITGSNILNLTLILGVAAVMGTVHGGATVLRREVPLTAAAVTVFGAIAWWRLDTWTATALTVLTAAALYLLVRWARQGRNDRLALEVRQHTGDGGAVTAGAHRAWVETVRAVAGLAGVLLGAQLLVVNASTLAERFGVPQIVIGFTLVALGTSLPELVTTIQAQRRGESALVVGNLFGSNLFNSLAGGAVVGFATGTGRPATAGLVMAVAMVLTTLLAWLLLGRGMRITRGEGVVLVVAYIITMPLLLTQ